MLYTFYGTDIQKSLTKARALVDSLRAKRPDASFVEVNAETWDPAIIAEHAGGQGLFSNKYIVYLDRVGEKKDNMETLVDSFPLMKESNNIFVVLEGKLVADIKKSFEKYSDKMVVTDLPEAKSKFTEFNIFSLADAVGERNAVKAWSIYRQALEKGHEPEAIVGTLFWQAKSMVLASRAKMASEAGLSPFVFTKAKKASEKYSEVERSDMLQKLISAYHDGHRGEGSMEIAVERMLLSI